MSASGGGWHAILYTFEKAREVGPLRLWRAMRSKNACKTCALGMGGQRGGMVNELGSFPEVCKKSLQAMAADLQPGISDDFWRENSIADLRQLSPRKLESCGRLTSPVVAEPGATHYRPITWDDAFNRLANRLNNTDPAETFWYFSGRSSNEAGFLLQLFARIYGTNNVNNCSYYCHQASGVGLNSSIGSGTATVVLDDVHHADCVFLIGGNPASNHPRLITSLMEVRRRGGEVIVINPVVETGLVRFRVPSDVRSLITGSEIASLYVQPHIGGDLALLSAIAKRIDELGAADENFLRDHCHDADELRGHLRGLNIKTLAERAGVSVAQIDEIANRYARAKNALFCWTMGITHHAHGVQNVQAIANLALLRGMVGRPHAGLLPIRGHSNVQGIGSVGVTPALKQAMFDQLESRFNVSLPTAAGLDTMGCMEAAASGAMRVGFCLGGNLYGSNPDATFAAKALSRLDQLVYLSTTLNTGHAHAVADETIILPVLARDEEPQATTQESMFNFVRLSDGGPARHSGPKSEVEVISRLAASVLRAGGPIDWHGLSEHRRIREVIAEVVPGFEKISEIDATKAEFQIGGRTFHAPKFATADGKAQLHRHEIPEEQLDDDQLRLMTVRSEGQFNTVVYEEEDHYRGQTRRDVVLAHPDDIERLGLTAGSQVTVRSTTGQMDNLQLVAYEAIRPGNVLMYYPEANALVPRTVDPQSKTPAFKGITVTVTTSMAGIADLAAAIAHG